MKKRSAPMVSRRCACCALAALFALPLVPQQLGAQTMEAPKASADVPMLDPWVPPEARRPSAAPPTQGAALRAQVERKLKQSFDAADVNRSGTLTREQARAGGLGFVVNHFDAIDRQRTGAVSFDDVKRYLKERGGNLN